MDRTTSPFRSQPLVTTGMPPGVWHLVANEGAERFSYYGMRAILVVFMTSMLMNVDGELDLMGEAEAKTAYHLFASAVYFFPFLGAFLADALWGKYRTIILLSLVYCAGHVALALDHTRVGLAMGLTLIAVGSGGIKPCVSANLGDQFSSQNAHLLPRAFSWFYFAINVGAFGSMLLTPWLLDHYGPGLAFGVPGILMFAATGIFYAGRRGYAHIPPSGLSIVQELKDPQIWKPILKLCGVYVFVAFFWSLYDQTSSAWVLQAQYMDRRWLGVEWLPSQIQAVNPILILIFIPLFTYGIFPVLQSFATLTPLRKIAIGLFITVGAFSISALIETKISEGMAPSIVWQLLAFVVITMAEVLVSITCLEFSYTQAPLKLKSLVMGLFLLSVSLGNAFTALVNFCIQQSDGTVLLEGAAYYWFFAGVMFMVACLFLFVAKSYREENFLQGTKSPSS
ncbi:MAG: POT family MFS transporter [Nitrospirales bacterium]|nr:POT family MFS transporter [Nitrospirales bacterium]